MALDFVAGYLGGIAGVVVGHPLDTIKVRLQVQDPKCPRYNGTWHCFRTIVQKESVRGLFRGVTSPLAGVAFINAITFGTYGNILRRLPVDWNPTLGVFVAGATAGLVQSAIASPIELAKSRLQVVAGSGHGHGSGGDRGGPLSCLAAVRRTDGWRRGVFRGLGVTAMRDAPAFGIYFATYELVCDLLTSSAEETESAAAAAVASPLAVVVAGGVSGTMSWVLTYPLDVVKTRIQTDVQGRWTNAGAFTCFLDSYRQEGVRSFSRGINSTILRAFPTNAATFLAVSFTFRLFGHRFQAQDCAPSIRASAIADTTGEHSSRGMAGNQVTAVASGGGGGGDAGGSSVAVAVTAHGDVAIKWSPLVLKQTAEDLSSIAVRELVRQRWHAANADNW